jgi:hypothetical protein
MIKYSNKSQQHTIHFKSAICNNSITKFITLPKINEMNSYNTA